MKAEMNKAVAAIRAIAEEEGLCVLIWMPSDVQSVRPELTKQQAIEVLEVVERRHDANDGVNWDTLAWAAEGLFPVKNQKADELPESDVLYGESPDY